LVFHNCTCILIVTIQLLAATFYKPYYYYYNYQRLKQVPLYIVRTKATRATNRH